MNQQGRLFWIGWLRHTQREIDRMLACFAPDPDVVLYGTGADEKRVGLGEIEAQA